MVIGGVVRKGVVVPDRPLGLEEGTRVRIEVTEAAGASVSAQRRGGWWRGQVSIAPDFDELPDDIRHAFGMHDE